MTIFYYIENICILLAILGLLTLLPDVIRLIVGNSNTVEFLGDGEKKAKFGVIIPARDESGVIEANILSVLSSDYPADKLDVYVILESEEDASRGICEKYDRVNIFYRTNLSDVGKGHALDECFKDIFNKRDDYDAFVILDADNILDEHFISEMNVAYQSGYDVACGKRDNKDWNASVVSSGSALTFTMVNEVVNKSKTRSGMPITVSGTGFFVRADILRRLGGWPFYELTEDYEFSNFAVIESLKTCYVGGAVYYDEQPVKIKQSIKQRSRWINGYFKVRKKYRSQKRRVMKEKKHDAKLRQSCWGAVPYFVILVATVAYLIASVTYLIISAVSGNGYLGFFAIRIMLILAAIYLVFAGITVLLFRLDKDIDITGINKIKTVFYHPVFLATYLIAAVRAPFIGNKWEKIEHGASKEENENE